MPLWSLIWIKGPKLPLAVNDPQAVDGLAEVIGRWLRRLASLRTNRGRATGRSDTKPLQNLQESGKVGFPGGFDPDQ